jgi:hypothetical protein
MAALSSSVAVVEIADAALWEPESPSSWVPVLVALGFATGFIHYLLDRSVYRMSDPKVRMAASGLVGNS